MIYYTFTVRLYMDDLCKKVGGFAMTFSLNCSCHFEFDGRDFQIKGLYADKRLHT